MFFTRAQKITEVDDMAEGGAAYVRSTAAARRRRAYARNAVST